MRIDHASGYIEEKNENKYLLFDSVDENKEVLKIQADVWDGIKNKIRAINGGKENDYGKDYMEIRFDSYNDFPLNKLLKFHVMTIIIRSVFQEDGKFYPQLFFYDTYCIITMLQYKKINASEGSDVNKTSLSKECMLCHYWFFKDTGFKFEPRL